MKLLLPCLLATAAVAVASPAVAAPTESAPLDCGGTVVDVTGFGRGQVLHVVGSTTRFVVTRAVTGGTVVFEAPGQAGTADLVSCTVTSPGSERQFLFEGFFTPRS